MIVVLESMATIGGQDAAAHQSGASTTAYRRFSAAAWSLGIPANESAPPMDHR
jgi:hypothetical protein